MTSMNVFLTRSCPYLLSSETAAKRADLGRSAISSVKEIESHFGTKNSFKGALYQRRSFRSFV